MKSAEFSNWLKRGLPDSPLYEDIETETDCFETSVAQPQHSRG